MMNRSPLKVTLAQINPIVGDVDGNAQKIIDITNEYTNKCDLIVFPELALSGYQPEDLILHTSFIQKIKKTIQAIENKIYKSIDLIFGSLWAHEDNGTIHNAAIHISGGKIQNIIHKTHLPNYGVFDEKRVFTSAQSNSIITVKDHAIGVGICEDFWFPDVAHTLKKQGADLLISLNGSPFEIGKEKIRQSICADRVKETGLPLLYVNQVGGQDDLVFDGGSFAMDKTGQISAQLYYFKNDIQPSEFPIKKKSESKEQVCTNQQIFDALSLGLRDYVHKNGFQSVILGLSGGIDSALSAIIAADALGADNVHCVMMPSPYTSQESLDDAEQLAKNLGCPYDIKSIEPAIAAYDDILHCPDGLTAENIQSRARGMLLMALSNRDGHMVLTTGNKSEMAVGYATIYGDMCGGFNALKDVYKTKVYDLSKWINRDKEIIPTNIITRAPSAELRPDQTDQDSLPDYDILDGILVRLIENRMGIDDIVKDGFDEKPCGMFAHYWIVTNINVANPPLAQK
jgi:NAD+ synthase